jgi:D-3-phosphoglycerate dehydrogenase / 2-oxoglutarate reductase
VIETVLVTDCGLGDLSPEKAIFAQSGLTLVDGQCKDEEDILAAIATSSPAALLVYKLTVSRRVLESCDSVRAVIRYGVGVENIDQSAAAELGITVCGVSNYATEEVADHALSLILSLSRQLNYWAAVQPALRWASRMTSGEPLNLRSATLGIIGLGLIGRAVARRAAAFGMPVIAYDPIVGGDGEASFARLTSWEEFWEAAVIVTLHTPLTSDTRSLINDRVFSNASSMRYLVNTSRAAVIDRAALERALVRDTLQGVAVDVWWDEPPRPDDPLLAHPKITVTPHTAWLSEGSVTRLKAAAAYAVLDALGQPRIAGTI